jgi:tetratricopeptide (TPR) repeat protein
MTLMKRTLTLVAATLALTGCAAVRDLRHSDANPYEQAPFYAKYLNTGSPLDAAITRTLEGLRKDPHSAILHNDLGALLVEKGFPKDAAREFERAVNADGKHFPAWYNLGLVRASLGDEPGARRAFARTLRLKPGHSPALFQLGLIEEQRDHVDRAVRLYAKAYRINPALLEVSVNPRVLDSKLTHLALLKAYPDSHTRESMQMQDAPVVMTAPPAPPEPAASPEAPPAQIVVPAPPAAEYASPRSAPEPARNPRARSRRPRRVEQQPGVELPADQQPAQSNEGHPELNPQAAPQSSDDDTAGEQPAPTEPPPPPPVG